MPRKSTRGRSGITGLIATAVLVAVIIVGAIVKAVIEAIARMPPGSQVGLAALVLAAAFVGIAVKVGWARNWLSLARKQKINTSGLAAKYNWFRWWYAPLALGVAFLTVLIALAAAAGGVGQSSVVYVTVTPMPTVLSTQEPTTQPASTKAPTRTRKATTKALPTGVPAVPTKTKAPMLQPTAKPTARPTSRPTLRPQPTSAPVNCCKHCGPNSKPCGDSCISRDKECHKSGGCACP